MTRDKSRNTHPWTDGRCVWVSECVYEPEEINNFHTSECKAQYDFKKTLYATRTTLETGIWDVIYIY